MEKIVQWEQENPVSNGRGLIDDFRLWGARRWSRTNAPPKKPRWRTGVARDFNHPNAFLSEGGVLPVVVESFPVASCAIEASVMGEGEGSGGGDGGARGELSPVGGSKGPEPLASPNVLHWVGWLPSLGEGRAPAERPSRYRKRAWIRSLLFPCGAPPRRAGGDMRGAASPRFVAKDAGKSCCPESDAAFRGSIQPQRRGAAPSEKEALCVSGSCPP